LIRGCPTTRSGQAIHPRISFAVYYQSRDAPPYHKATIDIPSPIPFAYRLYLIEKVRRDPHLKSPDFFDVARYPELRFVGRRVEPRSGDDIDVVGDLTIKGITREVVFRVEQLGQAKDPWGNMRAAFSAKTSIDRKDFGLTWNQVLETGGVMVGDRIEIEADIQAVKQVEAQVA
jgi:hypothetical protein